MWFQPEREGKYNIFCAEYCGLDHARMIADLRVVSEEAFHDWARQQVTRKFQPLVFEAVADPQHPKFEELGIQRDDLYATFCVSCHGPEGAGTGIEEARNFQQLDENWKNGGKVTDIFRTLTEGIEGTRMAAYPQFSAWQKVALAHKVRSFMPEGERPETTREDYDELEAEYRLDQIQVPKEPISVDRAMDILVAESAKK
jgi:mono/diheme cytochrome c family protein